MLKEKSAIYNGVLLLMLFTIANTSRFGASLSWVIIPCVIIVAGILFEKTHLGTNLLVIVFWISAFISTLLSDVVTIQRDMVTFILFCIVYIVATSIEYSKEKIRKLNKIYVLTAFIASIDILYNWLRHDYFVAWFKRASFRFLGVYRDPNYVMAYIVPAMYILTISLINTRDKKLRAFKSFVLITMMTSFLTTGSRGAMLSYVVGVALFFLLNTKISFNKKIKFLALSVVVILLGYICLKKILPEQSVNRLLNSGEDSRFDLWKSAIKVFWNHPVLGGGMGAASNISLKEVGRVSHNVYIDILSNFGLLGSVAFIIFFHKNCCLSTISNTPFLIGACGVFMTPMFFVNGFNTATFYFPLIILTIYSDYCRTERNEYEDLLLLNKK